MKDLQCQTSTFHFQSFCTSLVFALALPVFFPLFFVSTSFYPLDLPSIHIDFSRLDISRSLREKPLDPRISVGFYSAAASFSFINPERFTMVISLLSLPQDFRQITDNSFPQRVNSFKSHQLRSAKPSNLRPRRARGRTPEKGKTIRNRREGTISKPPF